MIALSVDTTSQSYAAGQVFGTVAIAVAALVLLWRLTDTWRNPSSYGTAGPDEIAAMLAKRRAVVIGVMVLIAGMSAVKSAVSYHPEPRAAEVESAAADAEQPRTPTVPESFAGYRLMTGEAAARAEASVLAGRPLPAPVKISYYDKGGDTMLHALFILNSTTWDPELADQKASESISQEFRNFFAGARAHDVTAFDPGPDGGRLSCGYSPTPGSEDQAVCVWSDATTFGSLRLTDPISLTDAADTTTALRTATMR
ncbi:hypothetical protein [Streptomyces sp. NPDC058613]|uniref:hypothetical protein n=1 Tax=Streptomyces sp. NPDC058613 TaxID=3346556 RepID=UPI003663BA5C